MSDEKTPAAAAGEQPWLRLATGVLQFIGGGLVALHEQESSARAPEPERPGDRNIRERVEGLGIRTDHAETIRQGWFSPPPAPPNTQTRSIPTLSFDEFAAAVASHLGSTAATPPTSGKANTGAEDHEAPEVAPTTRVDSSPVDKVAEPKVDSHAQYIEVRLSALERKCHDLLLLLYSDGARNAESESLNATSGHEASTSAPEASDSTETIETAPIPTTAGDAARESTTVVQGPWTGGRADGNEAAAPSSADPAGIYDAHERRVAALERTFESFGRMVEGLAARSRGSGPPTSE